MSSTVMNDRVTNLTYELIEPMVIGEMFGPKARAWFEKWRKSYEFQQTVSAERIAYSLLWGRHPSIKKLDRRTLIGRKYLEDRKRLYDQFVAREGEMPSDTDRIRRSGMLSGIEAN